MFHIIYLLILKTAQDKGGNKVCCHSGPACCLILVRQIETRLNKQSELLATGRYSLQYNFTNIHLRFQSVRLKKKQGIYATEKTDLTANKLRKAYA